MAPKETVRWRPPTAATLGSSLANSEGLSGKSIKASGESYSKDGRHWYDDGNVVFLVKNRAFRLHGSILSRRSSVLDQMISCWDLDALGIPGSEPSRIMIEGVKCIIVGDNPNDFSHILDLIYPDTLPGVSTEHLNVHNIMGMVRLARKYELQDLLRWAANKLAKDFLLLQGNKSAKKALEDPTRYGNAEFSVKVIQFARECALPVFLPLAFYSLATTDWSTSTQNAICMQVLTPADQQKILEARLTLTKMVLKTALGFAENGGPPNYCGAWSCSDINPEIWTDAEERWKRLLLHPIEELEYRITYSYGRLCKGCREGLVNRSRTLRDELIKAME